MEKRKCDSDCSPVILRGAIGLLFIVPGLSKLMNPGMIAGMLGGLGFPAAAFFGWVLLLSEIVFGAAVLVGWKVKYTTWPLILIMGVAIITVSIPALGSNPMATPILLFHLVAIASLASIYLTGAGKYSLDKKN
jgi:putative oxidoreductase